MRIVLITQDDPFYMPENLDFFLGNLPDGTEVVGCVVSKISPFLGKRSFSSPRPVAPILFLAQDFSCIMGWIILLPGWFIERA